MSQLYKVNPQLDIPIYRQLIDIIRSNIKSGKTPPGFQLPTVRDLADELNVARGTIKRAYDELEKDRFVEKVQGRGTFVQYRPENSDSRKDRAMYAIDRLFDELEELEFTRTEMRIFLDLKLQERGGDRANLKVAVVECNPEVLSQLIEQLRKTEKIDLYSYLLEDVIAYPYAISEKMDLVVTTTEHAQTLEKELTDGRKIAKIALTPNPHCVAQIVKLSAGEKIGILSQSKKYGELMARVCSQYIEQTAISSPCQFSENCMAYLADKTVILLPENYERYADEPTIKLIRQHSAKYNIISCAYQVDEGSLMYLKDIIQKLYENK